VGGGDQRFEIGTKARVLQIEAPEGPLEVMARGERRFRVIQWVAEEPVPHAESEELGECVSTEVDATALELAESTVRGALEYLATLDLSIPGPTDIELAEDPREKAWQLAGISPLGTLDHQDLLAAPEVSWLLSHTIETVSEALVTFRAANDLSDD
jgi:Lon protease-like protein